jgi:hypothetical protein
MSHDLTIVDEIDDWLSHLPYSKWADWDISSPDRRRLAAEWFAAQREAFESYRAGYHGDGTDLWFDEAAARYITSRYEFEDTCYPGCTTHRLCCKRLVSSYGA